MTSTGPEKVDARTVFRASWFPVLLMLVLSATFLVGGHEIDSQKYDQNLYHIQVIRQFEAQLPTPDVSNYGAATGPGYHLLYAAVGTLIGSDIDTLRWFSLVIAVLLIVAVTGFCTIRCSPRTAALVTAPLAVSYYLLGSAVQLQTDNLAWLLSVMIMGPLVFRGVTPWSLITSGCLLLLAVSVRQNFIWLAGPIVLAGFLSTPLARRRLDVDHAVVSSPESRWGLFGLSLLMLLPAVLLLYTLISLWGGLVPPNFQYFHSSHVTWVALGFALAIVGFYAPFFLLAVPRCMELLRSKGHWVLLAGMVGACCALIPPSDSNGELGRAGGLMWKLVASGPVLEGRSLVLAFFAAIGGGSIILLWFAQIEAGQKRGGLVLLCGWLATTSTTFLNVQSYQRFYDFPCLLLLVWGLSLCLDRTAASDRRIVGGPPLLAAILAVLFALASI
ncbi:MAG: hypothetical protein VX641_03685 [Planctomycetota bacterium]|nr:hypothetical protein [Planctomycetota bacterium]